MEEMFNMLFAEEAKQNVKRFEDIPAQEIEEKHKKFFEKLNNKIEKCSAKGETFYIFDISGEDVTEIELYKVIEFYNFGMFQNNSGNYHISWEG